MLFEALAEEFGLSPDDYGRKFSTGREWFRVLGIDPSRPEYPNTQIADIHRLCGKSKSKFSELRKREIGCPCAGPGLDGQPFGHP
jgi:hypothetical protein